MNAAIDIKDVKKGVMKNAINIAKHVKSIAKNARNIVKNITKIINSLSVNLQNGRGETPAVFFRLRAA